MNNLITICKNHLIFEDEKCIRCPVSKENEKLECYQGCFMPSESEGHNTLYWVRNLKKISRAYKRMSQEDTEEIR